MNWKEFYNNTINGIDSSVEINLDNKIDDAQIKAYNIRMADDFYKEMYMAYLFAVKIFNWDTVYKIFDDNHYTYYSEIGTPSINKMKEVCLSLFNSCMEEMDELTKKTDNFCVSSESGRFRVSINLYEDGEVKIEFIPNESIGYYRDNNFEGNE